MFVHPTGLRVSQDRAPGLPSGLGPPRHEEVNWFERTGLARLTGRRAGELEQTNNDAAVDARYLDVVPLPDGRYRASTTKPAYRTRATS